MKRQGNKQEFITQNRQNIELKEFAKSLFQQWDSQGFGKMKIIHLVKHFMALGLAANEEIAASFFKNLIDSTENYTHTQVLQIEINVDTFLSLF